MFSRPLLVLAVLGTLVACDCGSSSGMDAGGTGGGKVTSTGGGAGGGSAGGAAGGSAGGTAGGAAGGAAGGSAGGTAGGSGGGTAGGGTAGGGTQDAGTCCQRLAAGMVHTITWRGADGVLPDQACPPWDTSDSSSADAVLDAGVLIIDTATDGESISYEHLSQAVDAGPLVVLQARMRLVSGSASTPSRAPALIAGVFGAAKQKTMLQIEAGAIFLNSDENVRGTAFTLDTTTTAHDYRIEINLADAGVTVLVDGVARLSGSTFTEPANITDFITWGEGSGFAHGRSEWFSFGHDAYGTCNDDVE